MKKNTLIYEILKKRGFSAREAETFISSNDSDIKGYSKIPGIQESAEIIAHRIKQRKKFVIHGDYDVDGIAGTAIIFDFLYYKNNIDTTPVIPNRKNDGYGISSNSVQKIKEINPDIVLTVDSGISDIENVNDLSKDYEVIITDHHEFKRYKGEVILPNCKGIVHNELNKKHKFHKICGAATAFFLIKLVDEILTKIKFQDKNKIDKYEYLDLVSLATVCDLVPLIGENRNLVKLGLKYFSETDNIGLKTLIKVSNLNSTKIKTIDEYYLGFIIGPRINAISRVTNESVSALKLLLTKNRLFAKKLANELEEANSERKFLVEKFLKEINLPKKNETQKNDFFIEYFPNIPEGIIGLIAGKISQKYSVPAIVFSDANEEGIIKGSGRSPEGHIDLQKFLNKLNKLIFKWGGHKQAIGISLYKSNLEKFKVAFKKIYEEVKIEISQDIYFDYEFNSLLDLNIKEVEELKLLAPYGMGNPKPYFRINNVKISSLTPLKLGSPHYRIVLNQKNESSLFLEGVIFDYEQREFYVNNIITSPEEVTVYGYLEVDNYRTESPKVKIIVENVLYNKNVY